MNGLKKILLAVAVCFGLVGTAFAGADDAVVGMTATVEEFAEWADAAPSIGVGDWTGSEGGTTINVVGEYLTATAELTLYANADVVLTQAGTTNSGILTEPTNSDTLTTSYMINGAGVDELDRDGAVYKAADAVADPLGFFATTNTYGVTHTPGVGSYAIELGVKAESDNDAASDAGAYAASLTITATW